MRRIITVVALAISFCTVANAQVDLAGLAPYSHYTKAQIEAKFGKPTFYKADKSYFYYDENGDEVKGIYEIYKYPNMEINITTNNGLDFFVVYSKDYPVLTKRVSPAGVRVGQKASILTSEYHMKGKKSVGFTTEYSRKIGADWYYYSNIVNPDDDKFIVLIKDGIIYGFIFDISM